MAGRSDKTGMGATLLVWALAALAVLLLLVTLMDFSQAPGADAASAAPTPSAAISPLNSEATLAVQPPPPPAMQVPAVMPVPPSEERNEKFLELRADPQGHYHAAGMLNGRPVSYLIDTGASLVTISRKFANEAGVYHCRVVGRSETANGPVDVCLASGVAIEFGPFKVADAEVSIVPNMAVDALLGMNVLRTLDMRQAGGVLTIGGTAP